MTDQELIKALRHCGKFEDMEDYSCIGCPAEGKGCAGAFLLAADRLEALLAENDLLYREVAKLKAERDHFRDLTKKIWCKKRYGEDTNVPTKWVSVSERLPELTEKEKYWIEQLGTEVAPEFIVMVKGATAPTVLRFDGEKWFDDDNTWYRVAYWCNLPEPPSTEGVEQ